MKLRVMRTAKRETKKNQSTVKPKEANKNSDKIETPHTKTKIHHRGRGKRQKAKQTVKICQTCLKVKTKQKEERKNKVSQLRVHWMFI